MRTVKLNSIILSTVVCMLINIEITLAQRVGIETIQPEATLHVGGEDGLLVTGEFGAGEDLLNSGSGTKMFFYPKKSAFRVGTILGLGNTKWNETNIGDYSTAWGINTLASAYSSTAWGTSNNATGMASTAWGSGTLASELNATAWGQSSEASGARSTAWGNSTASGQSSTAWGNTTASGDYSTAWGNGSEASGILSTSWGENTLATDFYATAWGQDTQAYGVGSTAWGTNATSQSGYETALGRWNTNYTPNSTTGWNANDRLFGIGNGSSSTNRSDALVVLKNGNTGIGISNPQHKLAVEVATNTTPNGDGVGIVNTNGNYWNIHMSSQWLRFSANNANVSYINSSTGAYVETSDRRLKENIRPLQNGVLQKINQINTVQYNYIRDEKKTKTTGVIAQELKEVFPEFVHKDDADNYMGVNYAGLSVVAIKAIQEQQEEIENLNAKIKDLKEKMEYILKQIE